MRRAKHAVARGPSSPELGYFLSCFLNQTKDITSNLLWRHRTKRDGMHPLPLQNRLIRRFDKVADVNNWFEFQQIIFFYFFEKRQDVLPINRYDEDNPIGNNLFGHN